MRIHSHCVKNVHIRSYSGPYFPAFGLNTERSPYSVQVREKTDQTNSEYRHFSRSIWFYVVFRRHTMEHLLNISYGENIRKKYEELLSFCHSRSNKRDVFSISVYSVKIRHGHKRWMKKVRYWMNSYYDKLCVAMISMV